MPKNIPKKTFVLLFSIMLLLSPMLSISSPLAHAETGLDSFKEKSDETSNTLKEKIHNESIKKDKENDSWYSDNY